jgi:hypothetical protein
MADGHPERHFVWTAIPAGRVEAGGAGPAALLTVLLTPRLRGPANPPLNLSSFGMQRWPELLAQVAFEAVVGSPGVSVAARRVAYVTPAGEEIRFTLAEQLSAWNALFGAAMPVRPHAQTTYAGRKVRTFPAADAAKATRDAYGGAGRAHLEHRGEAPQLSPALRTALQTLRATWQAGLQPTARRTGRPEADAPPLARAYDFYRREDHDDDFTPLQVRADVGADEHEFHDVVGKLADHPLLLRALGLVVDLALPRASLAAADRLRITPKWPNPATRPPPPSWTDAAHRDICPTTVYELTGSRFVARQTGRVRRGMLVLTGAGVAPSANPRWEVVPFDVDGAVLRMVGAATGTPSGADESLPALRSMGFALVQRDRAQLHGERVARSQQLANPQTLHDAALTAEDLMGGYRIDVLDIDTGRWRSLCERRVRYTIGELSIGQDARADAPGGTLEEAYLRPLAASTGAGARDALYIHESVARWDGWSLAAPRPDRVVDTGAMPERSSGEPPFESSVEPVRGSLPRLYFGRQYRLRARIADLVGGGLQLDEVGHDEERTEVFTHRRFEPIPPPELVPTHKYEDGEGHERLVIRSDRSVAVAEYARTHGYRPYDLRQILAPKSSVELAMQHRFTFDSALGPEASSQDVARLLEVAKRADRELLDIPGAHAVGLEPGSDAPRPYVVIPEQGISLPWLADPMAKAVALHQLARPLNQETGLPGPSSGLPEKCLWQGDWHSRLPVALRLVPATAGCAVTQSEDRRTLTVALGPAEEVTLEISSCPGTGDVHLFGIAAWLGPDRTKTELIALGKHRMITPPRTVTLVHAVQRPLRDPGGVLISMRDVGATDSILQTDTLRIDTGSTARIDIHGRWIDRDDVPPAAPVTRQRDVHVGSYDVAVGPLRLPEIRQEFGDTRRRRVTFTVTAVSRFKDCFGRVTASDANACIARGDLATTDVPSAARPPAPKLLYTVPTFGWSQTTDGPLSLTRLRRGGGLRVFLERPWFVSGDEETLCVLAWWVGSSADERTLPHLSVAGRDPIWDTGDPPTLLTAAEVTAPVKAEARMLECDRTLQVLAFGVTFDAEGNRWYADVDLSKVAGSSYSPFVRLALARYQSHSVRPDYMLSPSVQTEPIQLAPHRSLRVTRSTGHASVVLEGLGPAGPRPNVVRAEVQVGEPAHPAAIAGWTTVYATSAGLGQALQMDVPSPGRRPLRLLVKESERYSPETSAGETAERERLVYVDTVDL